MKNCCFKIYDFNLKGFPKLGGTFYPLKKIEIIFEIMKINIKFVTQTKIYHILNCVAMKTKTLFTQLEKQSFHNYFKDGIFEILFGSMFIIFIINSYSFNAGHENSLFVRLLIIPVSLILALIKMFITNRRVGYVKFSKPRRKKQKWVLFVAVVAQIIPLAAYILSLKGIIQTEQKSQFFSLFIEFMFLILVFGLISYFTQYPVFFIVGIIYAFGVPFTIYLKPWLKTRDYGYGLMAIAGIILLVYGFYRFVLFLKNYPKLKHDEQ